MLTDQPSLAANVQQKREHNCSATCGQMRTAAAKEVSIHGAHAVLLLIFRLAARGGLLKAHALAAAAAHHPRRIIQQRVQRCLLLIILPAILIAIGSPSFVIICATLGDSHQIACKQHTSKRVGQRLKQMLTNR